VVSEIALLDDRTFLVTFSEQLAEEPVNLEVIDSDEKSVPVKEVVVDDARMTATVTLDSPMVASKAYSIIVNLAVSMTGGRIETTSTYTAEKGGNNLDESGTGTLDITTPAKLAQSEATKAAAKLAEKNKAAMATASANAEKKAAEENFSNPPAPAAASAPAPTSSTTTSSATNSPSTLASAPEVSNNGVIQPTVSNEAASLTKANADAAPLVDGAKKLPTTGPELALLLFVTILLSGTWFAFKKGKLG